MASLWIGSLLAASVTGSASLSVLDVGFVDDAYRATSVLRAQDTLWVGVRYRVDAPPASPLVLRVDLAGDVVEQRIEPKAKGEYVRKFRFAMPLTDSPAVRVQLREASGEGVEIGRFGASLRIDTPIDMPAVARFDSGTYAYTTTFMAGYGASFAAKPATVRLERLRDCSFVEVLRDDPRMRAEEGQDFADVQAPATPTGEVRVERVATVRLSNVRVNPSKLEAVGWDALANLDAEKAFLTLGEELDAAAPGLKAFVDETLAPDYRRRLVPFQAAQAIFRALKAKLTYDLSADPRPSMVLRTGRAQCTGGNRLMVAALRSIGLPARTVGGFFAPVSTGGTDGHRITEFFLPGVGWVPCDATPDQAPKLAGHLREFGNTTRTNKLMATWADDARYVSGAVFGAQPVFPKPESWFVTMRLVPEK